MEHQNIMQDISISKRKIELQKQLIDIIRFILND